LFAKKEKIFFVFFVPKKKNLHEAREKCFGELLTTMGQWTVDIFGHK